MTSLQATVMLAVGGAAMALVLSVGTVYLLARLAMRRRARQFRVKAASGASCFEQELTLSLDPAEALARGRAAIAALPAGAEIIAGDGTPGEVVGLTGGSEHSFGERVRVRVRRTTAGRAAIEIQSRPLHWQLFGGGINAENVAAIARVLQARASYAARGEPEAAPMPARADVSLATRDWLALVYLAAVALYTGLLIGLRELWPEALAAWSGWLDAVPLDPLRLLGRVCPAGAAAAGPSLVLQLNLIIVPTILAYTAYNTIEFRRKLERMDALNGILCLGSLVFLPLLVETGCSAAWAGDAGTKYQGLIRFVVEESAGGALYALLLVIFCNGVSLLPAFALAKIFRGERAAKPRG